MPSERSNPKEIVKIQCPVCEGEKVFEKPDLFAGIMYKEKCKMCKGKGVMEAVLVAE